MEFIAIPLYLRYILDADLATERDLFMYRAYLALRKFGIVRDEIGSGSPQLLTPLKTLTSYLSAGDGSKKVIFHFNPFIPAGTHIILYTIYSTS